MYMYVTQLLVIQVKCGHELIRGKHIGRNRNGKFCLPEKYMEVIGHAYLLKKGYFVMALCLSQTLSVMSGHSNRFLLDTSMPHSPERKKKDFL